MLFKRKYECYLCGEMAKVYNYYSYDGMMDGRICKKCIDSIDIRDKPGKEKMHKDLERDRLRSQTKWRRERDKIISNEEPITNEL